jgi:hypothetical protein
MTALPDWTEGTTYLQMVVPWVDQDGDAVDLTGATITGRLYNLATRTSRAIAGTLAKDPDVDTQMFWTPDAADVAAGNYEVQFTATFASKPLVTFKATWSVEAAIPAPS